MKNYYIKENYIPRTESVPKTSIKNGEIYWSEGRSETSKYYQYHVYKYALGLMQKERLESFADVGCGTGYKMMNIIYPFFKSTLGIDQEAIVRRNQKKYNEELFEYDDFDNPQRKVTRKFDVIVCADVIEHLIDPDKLLEYIKDISNKKTHILISTPERDVVNGKSNLTPKNSEHIREWNLEEFKKYLSNSGFTVVDTKIFPAQRFNFTKQYFLYLYFNLFKTKHCMMIHCKKN
jgi:2-polyprenyl-3-methyl-5-hydroxy-6-metoxy-1,4-benzoquinol methylase